MELTNKANPLVEVVLFGILKTLYIYHLSLLQTSPTLFAQAYLFFHHLPNNKTNRLIQNNQNEQVYCLFLGFRLTNFYLVHQRYTFCQFGLLQELLLLEPLDFLRQLRIREEVLEV